MSERQEGQPDQFQLDPMNKQKPQTILGEVPQLHETATQYLATLPEHERQKIQENIELAWEAFGEMWQFEFDESMRSCQESSKDQAKDIAGRFNLPDEIKGNVIASFTWAVSE